MAKKRAPAGNPVPPKNVSTPDAVLPPVEYHLGPESTALRAWVDAEEVRIQEERVTAQKTVQDYQNALRVLGEQLGNLELQERMVAATRHASEDSLRKLHGVGENFRVVGDKLTCVG